MPYKDIEKRREKNRKYYWKKKGIFDNSGIPTGDKISKKTRAEKREREKIYRNSFNGRAVELAKGYRKQDKINGFDIENNIDTKWVIDNIFSSKCIYCGDSDWHHLGADRIDNKVPHIPDNVVCACKVCNCERQCRELSVEGFIEYRKTHLRECDQIKKEPVLNEKGCIVKKRV